MPATLPTTPETAINCVIIVGYVILFTLPTHMKDFFVDVIYIYIHIIIIMTRHSL